MKRKTQAVSDEEIVSALLSSGTVKEASVVAGLPVRTMYDRMSTRDFQIMYREARAEIIRSAVYNLTAHITEAVDTIAEIMADPTNNPAVRMQAAQTLLSNAERFTARLTAEERGIQSDKETRLF